MAHTHPFDRNPDTPTRGERRRLVMRLRRLLFELELIGVAPPRALVQFMAAENLREENET